MSGNNLDFHKPHTPPSGGVVKLNFSLSDDSQAVSGAMALVKVKPTLQFIADARAPAPVTGPLVLTQSKPTLQFPAAYANNVWRGPGATPASAYQEARAQSPDKTSAFDQSVRMRAVPAETYQEAAPLGKATADAFENAARVRPATASAYQEAAALCRDATGVYESSLRLRAAPASRYEEATPVRRRSFDTWQYPGHVKVAHTARYQEASPVRKSSRLRSGQGVPTRRSSRLPWQEAKQPVFGHENVPVLPPGVTPFVPDGILKFVCPWLDYAGDDIRLNFAKYRCDEEKPPEPVETVIVPVKRVYIVINTVSLRRVDGNVDLPTFSMSLSIDADSWTWGFNAALPAETLDAVQAGSDGTPVELEAVINGTAYRVLAEQISRERTFGRTGIRVSGKGKSAILGAPYAPVQSFSNSTARTAQQLMNDALTINGTSIGWTVNWAATDWLVPAGAWSHQGSYITALNTIAGAAGAYIQPHPSQKTLNVLARYPTAPWNWGSVTPDFELPADVTMRESIEWLQRPAYNRVFVSGEGQGVLGQVTRTGTAGDILAPMVTDALITHADASRQRGLSILGDTGRQAHVSLRLPVLEKTGVIQPGKFVRYVDGGVTRLGIVRSTSVDVSMPEVFQTIGVETHVA